MTDLQSHQSQLSRIAKHPLMTILISSVILIIATVAIKELVSKPLLRTIFTSDVIVKTITALVGSLVMIVTYCKTVTYLEKKSTADFDLKMAPKDLSKGLALGVCAIGFTILALYFMNYYNFIALMSPIDFMPTVAFIWGAAVLEEIIFRGLFFRLIYKWKGPIIALIVSSVMFQLPHFMNSHTGILPATLGVLFGVVAALMYASTERLWAPIAFHFGWNIMQPAFGTTLSGVSEFTPLAEATLSGPAVFVGSQFGIEVSIFSFFSLAILGAYYYYTLSKRGYFHQV